MSNRFSCSASVATNELGDVHNLSENIAFQNSNLFLQSSSEQKNSEDPNPLQLWIYNISGDCEMSMIRYPPSLPHITDLTVQLFLSLYYLFELPVCKVPSE